MDVFDLNVKLTLDNSEYDKGLDDSKEKAKTFGSTVKGALETAAKVGVAAIAVAAAGVASLTKSAVENYSEYEQLVGGIETLFGAQGKSLVEYAESAGKSVDAVKDKYNTLMQAQETALNNANNAYKTAGMSANDYMETITSFAASLKQSTKDEVEAAQVADIAVQDMADNANKMGTNMSSIQDAYQGFAKQNYTMLDNLKLGYGGTKTEMERLLEDAEKLSGQEYDISNLSDVYKAIHEIQKSLAITGTTEAEAMNTIQGSANMTKAAWENVVTAIGKGEGLQDAFSNLTTALFGDDTGGGLLNNVIPRIQTVMNGIGEFVVTAAPLISDKLPALVESILPGLLTAAASLLAAVATSLPGLLTALFTSVVSSFQTLFGMISEQGPGLLTAAKGLIDNIGQGLSEGIPQLLEQAMPIILDLSESLRSGAGDLIDAGLSLLLDLADGLIAGLPTLIEYVPQIISNIAGIINDNAPKLLVTAGELILKLAAGLIQAIPTLVAHIPEILTAVADVFLAFNWISLGGNLITMLSNGIKSMLGVAQSSASSILNAIKTAISNLPSTLANIAKNGISGLSSVFRSGVSALGSIAGKILSAIVSAITGLPGKLMSLATSAVGKMKSAFTSGSWSSIGTNIINGIKDGISSAAGSLMSSLKNLASNALKAAKKALNIKSPSRVFRDLVGKMIPLGMALGVTDEGDSVTDSIVSVIGDAISGAEKAVSGVTLPIGIEGAQGGAFVSPVAATDVSDYRSTSVSGILYEIASYQAAINNYLAALTRAISSGVELDMNKREFGRLVREVAYV